ncbi:MAG TPA: VOC family protein [Opitutaceae bacterium]
MATPKDRAIDYIEIQATDLTKTKAFFTALLGWTFTDYGPDYVAFEDGRIAGGLYRSEQTAAVATGSVLVVLYACNLEASLQQARALGATISREIFSFPGGRRYHFIAPGSGEFAVWSDA